MNKQVFFDPQRKRWKRLRRVTDSLALAGAVVGILFIVGLLRMKPMQKGVSYFLFGMMAFLTVGLVAIVGAAVRDAQITPGKTDYPSWNRRTVIAS